MCQLRQLSEQNKLTLRWVEELDMEMSYRYARACVLEWQRLGLPETMYSKFGFGAAVRNQPYPTIEFPGSEV